LADSWPTATSSPRASGVTVDLSQAYGSKIVRGSCGGAMRKDEGMRGRRTRNGRKALTAIPRGSKNKAKTKRRGTENGEALR
jgi:hypothetical protein